MVPILPSGPVLERFRRDLAAVGADEAPFAIAVSGGPDSLALLLLAAASGGRIEAATVDHGLRRAGAAEAAFVAEICRALAIPHETLAVMVPPGGAGLQAEARAARYAALAGWMERRGLPVLLTGHHADDQAETLLMRLNRGSGVGGLAGVRANGAVPGGGGGLTLCRPLLSWRRWELAVIVAASGLDPVADPSNENPDFDRARLRARLVDADWLDVSALARSAAALADADAALAWTAERLFAKRVHRRGEELSLEPAELPAEILRRLVLRCLAEVVPAAAPRGEQVTALLAALAEGRTATLAGVKCIGGATWRFAPAPPRRGGKTGAEA